MATVTVHPDLAPLFNDTTTAFARLNGIVLQHETALNELALIDQSTITSVASDRIVIDAQSALGDTFEIELTGSGFQPVSTIEALAAAIQSGLATGDLDGLTVTTGGTEILRVDIGPTAYTLTSGIHSFQVEGTLPASLDDISTLASGLLSLGTAATSSALGQSLTALVAQISSYDIDAIRFYENAEELLSLTLTPTQAVLTADGYTLTVDGTLPTLADAGQLLTGGDLPLTLGEMSLYGPDQVIRTIDLVSGGTTDAVVTGLYGWAWIEPDVTESGNYYLSVGGLDDQFAGTYTLFFQDFDNPAPYTDVSEGQGGVPADVGDTLGDAFVLDGWTAFTGRIGAVGDRDVFVADLTAGGNYEVELELRITAGDLSLWDGLIDIDTVSFTDPDGTLLGQIANVGDLADFEAGYAELLAQLGVPNAPDFGFNGWITGDPHLLTLDGVDYDFHAAGEYILLRDRLDSSGFELQSRMGPIGDNVSANIAAAMRTGDGTAVMVDSADTNPLWIGGVNTTLADGTSVGVGADRIYRDGSTYVMVLAGDDGLIDGGDDRVGVTVFDNRIDIGVSFDTTRNPGVLEGLLGNGDGIAENDIALANGVPLDRPLTFDDLYGQYRQDWRLDAADSLFTYDTGESTDGFYLPNFPTGITTTDDFDPSDVAAAQAAVTAGGLTPGTANFSNAVLDFLLTGDGSYIQSAAAVPTTPLTDSAEQDTSGGLAGLSTLSVQVNGGPSEAMAQFTPTGANVALMARSGAGGVHEFELVAGETGTVTGTAVHQRGVDPNVEVIDALNVLRMAIGLDPLGGPADAFDFIAADMDQGGSVEVTDALDVLRYAVGLDTANAPRWVFADAALAPGNVNKDSVPTDLQVSVDAIAGDVDITMQAILLGNIDVG